MSKLVPKTFKIEKRHKIRIESRPYSKAPGELVRILLDEFFDGKLPTVSMRFNKVLADRKKENGKPKSNTGAADDRKQTGEDRSISNNLPNLQGAKSNTGNIPNNL